MIFLLLPKPAPICDVEVDHRMATGCNIGNIAYRLSRLPGWNPDKETFDNNIEANKRLTRPMRKG